MPNGYTFSYLKVKQNQDEKDKIVYECRINLFDLTGKVVEECSAVDIDAVDAERHATDRADAFMR
jgi:hypothetical protein